MTSGPNPAPDHGELLFQRRNSTPPSIDVAEEAAAYSALYRLLLPRIRSFLTSILDDPHEAEDAAHDVFVKLITSSPEGRLRNPRAWLFEVARNRGADIRRDRARYFKALKQAESLLQAGSSDDLYSLIDDEAVIGLIEPLPLRERQTVILHFFMDFTHPEVAELLDISHSAARQLTSRAIRRLRNSPAAYRLRPRRGSGPRPSGSHDTTR